MKRTLGMIIAVSILAVLVGINYDQVDVLLFNGQVDLLAGSESSIPDDGIIYNSKEMELWWELSTGKYYINKPKEPNGACFKTPCCAPSTDMDCCDFYQVGWECDNVIFNFAND